MPDLERNILPQFLPLLEPHSYKIVRGGRAGAKSHGVAEILVAKSYEKPRRIVGLREVQSSIKESVKQTLTDKIEDMGLSEDFDILDQEIRGKNGSLFFFKGMQAYNSNNIKSLEGVDIAWVEEAQTLSHISLRMLRPTIRKPGSEIFFTYNPRYPTDAIDELARNPPPDTIIVETDWSKNPYLSEKTLREIEDDYKKNPAIANHVWGGGYEVITEGAYYAHELAELTLNIHITDVSHDRALPTFAAWDLGIGDHTAIWVFQVVGQEWHFLRSYASFGVKLAHYIDWIQSLPYKIDTHILPHDAEARELQSGKSRKQFLEERGLRARVLPRSRLEDGIAAVRMMLSKAWFDADGCQEGLEALRRYRAEFVEKRHVFKPAPVHDDASHYADAMRYAVLGFRDPSRRSDWAKPIHRELYVP